MVIRGKLNHADVNKRTTTWMCKLWRHTHLYRIFDPDGYYARPIFMAVTHFSWDDEGHVDDLLNNITEKMLEIVFLSDNIRDVIKKSGEVHIQSDLRIEE